MKSYDERMQECPKCGTKEIRGPIYICESATAGECLKWTCGICSYVENTKCRDAKRGG